MLQIKDICKEYRTGSLVQKALDHVSLNLRDNEFVAILGPSGSGKTTLLNIIGGLDRYDSGDLIINGISTKKYKDRDWDSYRNHTIGFVFQSYNLIPHQTILSNVELALTISGISGSERKHKAAEALERVGLGDQIHKKPNQLSGGQMQRVAIARALVNDPDILLADEPTGALDSETSVQVMDLLKEVANDRLVVMVTHNPELAEAYATRIVNLKDGGIRSDSDPYILDESEMEDPTHRNLGRASMSFLTALTLSFNNLWTKKARTVLVAFAGSIGIIGIALILSLSNGVNGYIKSIEEETLSQYPLQIQSASFDLSSLADMRESAGEEPEGEVIERKMVTTMFSQMASNDLKALKSYLDSPESEMTEYTNAIEYTYSLTPQIFRLNEDSYRQVNPDKSFQSVGIGSTMSSSSVFSQMMSTDDFYCLPDHEKLYTGQYTVMAGRWPQNKNECIVILTSRGYITDFMLYTLGLRDAAELDDMVKRFSREEDVKPTDDIKTFKYTDFLGIDFKVVGSYDFYQYDDEYKVWKDKTEDEKYMLSLIRQGMDLEVVGVAKANEDADTAMLTTGIYYTPDLVYDLIDKASASRIAAEQLAKPDTNVFTGKSFDDKEKDEFDMSKIFAVDQDALSKAFQFDASKLTLDTSSLQNSMDFSNLMSPEDMKLDLPDGSDIDFASILSQLNIKITTDHLGELFSGMMQSYMNYASEKPETDYQKLPEAMGKYLETDAAQSALRDNINAILDANQVVIISQDQLEDTATRLMNGFQAYILEQGVTDPSAIGDLFPAYLQTEQAQSIIGEQLASIESSVSSIEVSDEQLQKLTGDLLNGYNTFASENELPDLSKLPESFSAWLTTDEAQGLIGNAVTQTVNLDEIQQQLSSILSETLSGYSSSLQEQLTGMITKMMGNIASSMESALTTMMTDFASGMQDAIKINPNAFAEAITVNMDQNSLQEIFMSMMTTETASYDGNLRKIGFADNTKPASISIYPKDFAAKEEIVKKLDDYNDRMREIDDEKVITYTDYVGLLMSSVTNIIDTISYVLIAFVSISLIVSSIMIGVITYISVLERKKEIGILRAIGASKRNISQVFNAETFIIGLLSGLFGVGISELLLIPGNYLIHVISDNYDVNAFLQPEAGVILIILSVILTLIGGIIPSRKAAKSDPVTALRTE